MTRGYEENLQFVKQHYEKKIVEINETLINDDDELKSKMSLPDDLIQHLENELNKINLEYKNSLLKMILRKLKIGIMALKAGLKTF